MNIVPIVFAFDNNLVHPAAVCIYSLLANAKAETQYDIYILYPFAQELQKEYLIRVEQEFPSHSFTYLPVEDKFEGCYEIRGINNLTYYRLRIPELIPQYDKIFYSDVDVIFRNDLAELYYSTDLEGKYVAGVNSLAYLDKDLKTYYDKIGLDSHFIIYAGNILINSKLMRENNLVEQFTELAKQNFRFQDLDIINIVCKGKIKPLPMWHCLTTYLSEYSVYQRQEVIKFWPTTDEIKFAQRKGVVHYNGKKPWKSYCINFDIWWEYYRKSPIFDEKFYFDFFYNRLNELDQLSLWKRIKILIRYFVYGRQENS